MNTDCQEQIEQLLPAMRKRGIACVVLGASAGGLDVLSALVASLHPLTPFPVVCVSHLPPTNGTLLPEILTGHGPLPVTEAESTERLRPGHVYTAPPDYHLSIEADHSFALSAEKPVWFSRPSIDVLFESAAGAFRGNVLGVLLTGANADGAAGLLRIQQHGGFTAVQDPDAAEFPEMPRAALAQLQPDIVADVVGLARLIGQLSEPLSPT